MTFDPKKFEATQINGRNQITYWKNPFPQKTEGESFAPAKQIRATTGLGKTTSLLKMMSSDDAYKGKEIRYYAPDHAQALEIASKARKLGIRTQVIQGRSSNQDSPGYCARYNVAKAAAKAGLSVHQSCCQQFSKKNGKTESRCPHFESCQYLKQWVDSKPALRILSNNYVFLPEPSFDGQSLPKPKLAVVDESVVAKTTDHYSFPAHLLEPCFDFPLRTALETGSDFQDKLWGWEVDAEAAWDFAEDYSPMNSSGVVPDMEDRLALNRIGKVQAGEHKKLEAFYRSVAKEFEFDRPLVGVSFHKDEVVIVNGEEERQDRWHVHRLKECKIPKDVPLIVLDADANMELNERIFQRPFECCEIVAKPQAMVTQVFSTMMSNKALLGNFPKTSPEIMPPLAKASKIVADVVAKHDKVLVVLPKQAESALKDAGYLAQLDEEYKWHGADVIHFGALRGQDKWKDHDAIVVIGRNQPPVAAIEHLMRALSANYPEEPTFVGNQKLPTQLCGYRMADGSLFGVETPIHPDPLGQMILEQVRECETTQAIGRLRLVHCQEPKAVYLLCALPVDVGVDSLVSLDALAGTKGRQGPLGRLREALDKNGMLPLGARDLHRLNPELFPTKSSARDALKAARKYCLEIQENGFDQNAAHLDAANERQKLNGGELLIEYILGFDPHLRAAQYRRKGQRGKASWVVFNDALEQSPKFKLSNLLNEQLALFSPV